MISENDLKFQTLLETAPVAIVVVNPEGQITLVNSATEQLFLYDRDELLGQPLEVLLPERLRSIHRVHRRSYHAEPHVRAMGVGLDLVGLKRNGVEFPLEIGLSTVALDGSRNAIAFITDISARRQSEETQERLREELQQYAADLEIRVRERTQEIERRRKVAEGLRDILAVLNSNLPMGDTLKILVRLAAQVLGAPAAVLFERDLNGGLSAAAYHGVDEDRAENWRGRVGVGVVGQSIQRELPISIADTRVHPVEDAEIRLTGDSPVCAMLAVPLVIDNGVYGALGLYYAAPHHFGEEEIDLSVTVGRQASLAIGNARLRQEVAHNAVVAERSRLARELHDAVTQTLFAASITADVLPRVWERSPEMGAARLNDLRQLTKGALAEMRSLLYELRPTVLAKTDMRDLLHQLGEALRGRAQVEVEVMVEVEGVLPPEVHMAFYRIAQEACNNIAKHAQAQRSVVTLRQIRTEGLGSLNLSVWDDGIGFLPHTKSATMLGLEIMRERADAIGATLSIDSLPGSGTTVSVEWQEPSINPHGL